MSLNKNFNIETFRGEFFLDAPTHVPLNNAGITLLPKTTVHELEIVSKRLATDGAYLEPLFIDYHKSKELLAKFLGTEVKNVSWTQNCSAAISIVAAGYEAVEGEEIVIFENDYPANFYPWVQRAKKHGSLLKIVKAHNNLCRPADDVIKEINSKTRVVAISMIHSDCGYLMDISAIADAAHKVGALVVVDTIQSLGVYPFDFSKSNIDVLCCGTHKWLCGPVTAGILAIKENKIQEIKPLLHGATNYGSYEDASDTLKNYFEDSRRFEQGSAPLHPILGARKSIEVLMNYGVDKIYDFSMAMRKILETGVKEMGFNVMGDSVKTGPQLSFFHPRISLSRFSEALNKEKISHALRPAPIHIAPEAKVLRLSPFAYNTDEEMHFALSILRRVLSKN